MFKKILIANRGEIALRVICACKELGIETVAVYSEADRYSLHVRFADEAVCIGPPRSADSYLNVASIISAAEITGAEAIHPGYGFLAESAYFAEVCQASNLTFIGPSPEAMRMMGDKNQARRAMAELGLPVLPGSEVIRSEAMALEEAERAGYPVMVKAAAGGGGRGMRIVRTPDELPHAIQAAQNEAAASFGTPDVYLEKYIESPRHIEFQVLGDQHGKVVHFGERECTIQRRHQKLVEESPSTQLDQETQGTGGLAGCSGPTEDWLHQRRDGRVPDGRESQASLPGDEHPHSGRTRGDRNGDGGRSREDADSHRGRRAIWTLKGRRLDCADMLSSAGFAPKTRKALLLQQAR